MDGPLVPFQRPPELLLRVWGLSLLYNSFAVGRRAYIEGAAFGVPHRSINLRDWDRTLQVAKVQNRRPSCDDTVHPWSVLGSEIAFKM